MRTALGAAVVGLAISASAMGVTHNVTVSGLSFTPQNLVIDQGDTVQWNWVNGFHTVTSGSGCSQNGSFNFDIDPGNPTASHQFNSAGLVNYFCDFHCFVGMTGTITVNAVASVPTVSEWGMIGLALLTLTGGTLIIRKATAQRRVVA